MMELKGKKVLVVGLGKSGLAAALFLRRHGAQVTVSDVRSAEALAKDIPACSTRASWWKPAGTACSPFAART
jgi:UDP-N-acetylmuramoylalanine-D-glutamate ligase